MRRITLILLLPLALIFSTPAVAKCVPTKAVVSFLREASEAGAKGYATGDSAKISALVAAMQANTAGMPEGPPVVAAFLIVRPGGESGSAIILSGEAETCVILTGPTPGMVDIWNKGTGSNVSAGQGA